MKVKGKYTGKITVDIDCALEDNFDLSTAFDDFEALLKKIIDVNGGFFLIGHTTIEREHTEIERVDVQGEGPGDLS